MLQLPLIEQSPYAQQSKLALFETEKQRELYIAARLKEICVETDLPENEREERTEVALAFAIKNHALNFRSYTFLLSAPFNLPTPVNDFVREIARLAKDQEYVDEHGVPTGVDDFDIGEVPDGWKMCDRDNDATCSKLHELISDARCFDFDAPPFSVNAMRVALACLENLQKQSFWKPEERDACEEGDEAVRVLTHALKPEKRFRAGIVGQPRNGSDSIGVVYSNAPITLDRISRMFEVAYNYDFSRDSLTLDLEADEIDLDEWEIENPETEEEAEA
jgi:hypothetical protein